MFGAVVLLKHPFQGHFLFSIRQHDLFKYFDVSKLIHDPWYAINRPDTIVREKSPYHDACTTMLHCLRLGTVSYVIHIQHVVHYSTLSKIVRFGSKGRRQFVRRPPNTEFKPQYTLKTVKHGGASIMIWGCFSYSGADLGFWGPYSKSCQGAFSVATNKKVYYACARKTPCLNCTMDGMVWMEKSIIIEYELDNAV